MIQRIHLTEKIKASLENNRVVALVGPRQCGKTTLARQFVNPGSANYFDLEDPVSLSRLSEPKTGLENLTGIICIDEIQKMPDLFSILRVLADRDPLPSKLLILGSASPKLLKQSSESLAGRIEIIEISGFSAQETGLDKIDQLWIRGGFPLSFLAKTDEISLSWRKNFIRMVLERDLPELGFRIPSPMMMRFWAMLAHYNGQVWNGAEPARSLGISESTVRRYLDILSEMYMIRLVQPWFANISKRQTKSPKIYFRDTGLLHAISGITTSDDLLTNPQSGASWEGFVVNAVIEKSNPDDYWFWRTHNGAEVDLIIQKNTKKIGFEVKRSDAPKMTPSLRAGIEDLGLEKIYVIYPGKISYPIHEKVTVVPFSDIFQCL